MDDTYHTAEGQATLWNRDAGRAWVETQELLDGIFQPFKAFFADVCAYSGARVLDVGCGAGDTTLSVARLLGPDGRCAGIDISEPMIAAARSRAETENTPATFIRADGQDFAFEPASFDRIISRFGVMFFEGSRPRLPESAARSDRRRRTPVHRVA